MTKTTRSREDRVEYPFPGPIDLLITEIRKVNALSIMANRKSSRVELEPNWWRR